MAYPVSAQPARPQMAYPPQSMPAPGPGPAPYDMGRFEQEFAELQRMVADLDGDGIPDIEQGGPAQGGVGGQPGRIPVDARSEQDYSDQFGGQPPRPRMPQRPAEAGGVDVAGLGEEAKARIAAGEPREQVIQDLFLRVTRSRANEANPQRMAQAAPQSMTDVGPQSPEVGFPGTMVEDDPEGFGYVGAPQPTGPDLRNRLTQASMPRMEEAQEAPLDDEVQASTVRTGADGEVMRFPGGEPIPDLSDAPSFGQRGFAEGLGQAVRDYAPEIIGSAMGPLGRLATAAPRATAAAAGLVGLTAASSEAGTNSDSPLQRLHAQRATLEQRRSQLADEMQRQQSRNKRGERPKYDEAKSQYDALTSELSGIDAMISEAQRQAGEEQRRSSPEFQLELQQKAADLERQEREREAAMPFRERYPEIAGNLPAIGLGLAAGLPFALGAAGRAMTHTPLSRAGRVDDAIRRGEETLRTGRNADYSRSELANYVSSQPSQLTSAATAAGKGLSSGLAGGALAAEAGMFPDQYDAYNLPPGEAQDRAWERMTDPMEYLGRAGIGAVTGLSGYKASGLVPKREVNYERAEALRDALSNRLTRGGQGSRAARDSSPDRVITRDASGNYHGADGRFVSPPRRK